MTPRNAVRNSSPSPCSCSLSHDSAAPGSRSDRSAALSSSLHLRAATALCRAVPGDVEHDHADRRRGEQRDVVAVACDESLGRSQTRRHRPAVRIVAEVARQLGADLHGEDRALLDGFARSNRVVALLADGSLHLVDCDCDLPQLRWALGRQ